MRWNERLLTQAASQENDVQFRKRTGRIDKWKEVTRVAAAEHKVKVELPDKIESLVLPSEVLLDPLGMMHDFPQIRPPGCGQRIPEDCTSMRKYIQTISNLKVPCKTMQNSGI